MIKLATEDRKKSLPWVVKNCLLCHVKKCLPCNVKRCLLYHVKTSLPCGCKITLPHTSVLSLEGFWKVDAKYGRQFSVEKFEETLPATVYGIEKYLGSGLVKGVGPKFAKRIVQKFGKDTLDVIEEHPDSLLEVEGIGKIQIGRAHV